MGVHPVRSEKRKPPVNIRFIAPTWEDSVRGVLLKKFQNVIKRTDLFGGSWETAWSEKHRCLTTCFDGNVKMRGSTFRFFTGNQPVNAHAGDDVDACYIDEHIDRKYFDENVARLTDRGGYMVLSMTPDAGMTWEEEEIVDRWTEGDEDYKVWFFDSRLNPYLSREGLAQLIKTLSSNPELFKAKIQGRFVALSGLVYPMFREKIHVIDDDWEVIAQKGHKQVILDAHKNKPHAVMWLHWDKEGDVYIYRTAMITSTDGGPAELAKKIRILNSGEPINDFIMDESMGGTVQQEKRDNFAQQTFITQLNNAGLPFVGTNQASDKSVEAGIEKVKDWLRADPITHKSRVKIFRSCGNCVKEFKKYQYRRKTPIDDESYREKLRNIDDDLVTCFRYGLMAEPYGLNLPHQTADNDIRYDKDSGMPIYRDEFLPHDIDDFEDEGDTGFDLDNY